MRRRGSILLEAVFAIFPLVLASVLCLELVRRAQYEVVLHHAAFLFTRERALGESFAVSRARAVNFLEAALGQRGKKFGRPLNWVESGDNRRFLGKLHVKFPVYLPFEISRKMKRNFEITKECRFFYSR